MTIFNQSDSDVCWSLCDTPIIGSDEISIYIGNTYSIAMNMLDFYYATWYANFHWVGYPPLVGKA